MTAAWYIFSFLVFPGFLFTLSAGLIAGWADRKLTARIHWRKGPPWYQNFIDVAKLLFYKETLIPEGASIAIFLGMPLIALSTSTLVSTILFMVNGSPGTGFIGDLLAVIYLMMIPSIALMLGGFSSGNVHASVGSSREMKLILSYELPFILALIVPIIKSGYAIKLGDMMMNQHANGLAILSVSGVLSFIAMLFCVQAKLGLVPFDMAEAETEIMAGPYTEYSGKALAVFKMVKAVMTVALPIFMVTVYFGGIKMSVPGVLTAILEYMVIILLMVLIKNTNPRLRIDQAMRFFWGPVAGLALLSAVLAYFGW